MVAIVSVDIDGGGDKDAALFKTDCGLEVEAFELFVRGWRLVRRRRAGVDVLTTVMVEKCNGKILKCRYTIALSPKGREEKEQRAFSQDHVQIDYRPVYERFIRVGENIA